jgi:hypothetical protein
LYLNEDDKIVRVVQFSRPANEWKEILILNLYKVKEA